MQGLGISLQHFNNKKNLVATLQYPHEKWPIEDRHIGFDLQEYNVIRSRLHVDIDDCIGCNQCMRACPVDCIAIESVKPPKGSEYDPGMTGNGTQKKMLVARFDIDLTECMYCNLCTFPCPEECIYMVGGPNSSKHEIDYEFAKRDRKDLIFRFATATEAEILAAGGDAYLNKKKGIVEEKPVEKKTDVAKPVSAEPKVNFEPVNVIEDRMTRSLAKKAYTGAIREGKDAAQTSQAVKAALEDAGKYTADLDTVIASIATAELTTAVTAVPTAVTQEKPAAEDGLSVKILNDITDRMSRGTAKKAFMAAEREGKDPAGIAAAVTAAVTEAGKMTDEVQQVIAKISSAGGSAPEPAAKPEQVKPAASESELDIKVLNAIEDKMTRGLAKKTFLGAKREGKSDQEIVAAVRSTVEEAGKLDDETAAIIKSLLENG